MILQKKFKPKRINYYICKVKNNHFFEYIIKTNRLNINLYKK